MADVISKIKTKLEPVKNTLIKQPMVVQAKDWYGALPDTDRKIVNGVGLLAIITLVYLIFIVPLQDKLSNAESKLKAELKLHQWMQDNAQRVTGGKSTNSTTLTQSVLTIVNQSSSQRQIKLQRFEPNGSNSIRIWVDGVAFDDLVAWLEYLQFEASIGVEEINIEDTGAGRVNVRATLSR